jgi:hypothetical protein
MEALGVTQSTQRALGNALCQFLCWSTTIHLRMWIIFLFVDSARPFPEGNSWLHILK